MAEAPKKVSFENLPPHLISEVLICGGFSAIDLVNIELTCKAFGSKNPGCSGFKTVADQAAAGLCSKYPMFVNFSEKKQKELLQRCEGNWKRVLRFLQSIVESSGMVETSRGKMQIIAAEDFTMAIKNSKVFSCGSNQFGALGLGPCVRRCYELAHIELPFSPQVVQVSASKNNAAFVMQSGEVFTCGKNSHFECGHVHTNHPIYEPMLVEALKMTPCKQVAVGLNFTVVLTREGHVYTVGDNTRGQLGHGDTVNRQVPNIVEVLKKVGPVVEISAGPCYVLAVTADGSVYSFGDGTDHCLGHGGFKDQLLPQAIQALNTKSVHILSVCAGDNHAVAIDSNGYVYTWGRGSFGALGHGDENNKPIPQVVLSLKNHLAVQVCTNFHSTFVVVENGLVYGLGKWSHLLDMDEMSKPQVLEYLRPHRIVQVGTGRSHAVMVTQQGHLLGQGDNTCSQLGHSSFQVWVEAARIPPFKYG